MEVRIMLGAPIMPVLQLGTGGSLALAIVSLVLLAAFVWVWVAYMRRQDRTVAAPRPMTEEYRKAA